MPSQYLSVRGSSDKESERPQELAIRENFPEGALEDKSKCHVLKRGQNQVGFGREKGGSGG